MIPLALFAVVMEQLQAAIEAISKRNKIQAYDQKHSIHYYCEEWLEVLQKLTFKYCLDMLPFLR